MIERIVIENLRCFDRIEVDGLRRFNLIVGKNGVGKTALLEGVMAGVYLTPGNPLAISAQRFLVSRGSEMIEPRWTGLLRSPDEALVVALSWTTRKTKTTARVNRPAWSADRQASALSSALVATSPDTFSWEWTVSDGDLTRTAHSVVGPDGSDRGAPQIDLVQGDGTLFKFVGTFTFLSTADLTTFSAAKQRQRIDTLLRAMQFLEPSVRDIEILSAPGMLHVRLEDGSYRPIGLLGEGAVRATSLLISALEVPGGVLVIDEIERGLHKSALVEVMRALRFAAERDNIQVFATTHSYECIQAFDEVFADKPDDLALVRPEKVGGAIEPAVFSPESRSAALDAFSEVR